MKEFAMALQPALITFGIFLYLCWAAYYASMTARSLSESMSRLPAYMRPSWFTHCVIGCFIICNALFWPLLVLRYVAHTLKDEA